MLAGEFVRWLRPRRRARVLAAALLAAPLLAMSLLAAPGQAQMSDAPGISEVVAGDGALTVVWDAPTGTAGGDVVAYDLRHIASDAADKADSNWTVAESVWESGPLHHVLDGLANGTGYDVQVRAVTATAGPWSATAAGTPSDHGDSWQSATALDLGVPAGGLIGSGTDTDYFTVTLTETLGMLIYTTGGVNLKGSLQDRFQPLDDGVVAEFLTGANISSSGDSGRPAPTTSRSRGMAVPPDHMCCTPRPSSTTSPTTGRSPWRSTASRTQSWRSPTTAATTIAATVRAGVVRADGSDDPHHRSC